jgi:hypothetical protein
VYFEGGHGARVLIILDQWSGVSQSTSAVAFPSGDPEMTAVSGQGTVGPEGYFVDILLQQLEMPITLGIISSFRPFSESSGSQLSFATLSF